ncbi:MAG: hypothetical protein IJX12_02810 [Lachnospiraceae bacterium]|nr:hypothetical protein [Lachnospiraceae bacterium]
MKKRILILSAIFSVLLFNTAVFAEESTKTEEEIREEILENYAEDPEYNKMVAYSPELAEEYIDMLVQDRMGEQYQIEPTATDTYGTIAYCTVPVIEQSTTTNCSAATLLQTMYGLGKQSSVSGSTYAQKQSTLYNYTTNSSAPGARIESTPGTSLWVYEITLYLNSHLSSYSYEYRLGENMGFEQFKTYIWDSLVHNRPVMLHANTKYLSYYNNTELYHYLSLDYYDRSRGIVTIKDCNYDDAYGGSHSAVPVLEAYYAINKTSGRYLISD